jgi:tight adherence protein C
MQSFINENLIYIAIISIIILFMGIGLLLIGLRNLNKGDDKVTQRLEAFVENHEHPQSQRFIYRLLPREINGSFFSRTFKPWFQKIVDFFGKFTPSNSIARLDTDLRMAGNPFGMHAQEFYGVRVILLIFGILLALLVNYKSHFTDLILILMGGLVILITLLLPRIWLNSRIFERKDEFRRNLPDALDMLSVCASAGLGFDQSLKKICELWPTLLSAEFKHVLQEMDMGVSRAEALRNMSERIGVEEITSFVAIIVQAESIGMSFADVLHSQAQQMRILRHFRAKEIANQMPAKMIIPLVVFIFPALIAVLIGPIIPTILGVFL